MKFPEYLPYLRAYILTVSGKYDHPATLPASLCSNIQLRRLFTYLLFTAI